MSNRSSNSNSSNSSSKSSSDIKEGDRVNFNIGQNELQGTVTEVLTSPSEVDGRIAHASKKDPRVAVQYDGTGTEIIRTMNQVEKIQQEEGEGEGEGKGDQGSNNKIRAGDRVSFHIGQNRLEGTIKRILTSPSEVDGRLAHASEDEPRYVIHYDGTNSDLIRTDSDLEKMDADSGSSSGGQEGRQSQGGSGSNSGGQSRQSQGGSRGQGQGNQGQSQSGSGGQGGRQSQGGSGNNSGGQSRQSSRGSGGQGSQSSQGGEGDVQEGDVVKFNIGQNELQGTVTEVLTSPTNVDGRIAHASKDDPRVSIHYDGTGSDIIRTMGAVDKVDQDSSSGGQEGRQSQGGSGNNSGGQSRQSQGGSRGQGQGSQGQSQRGSGGQGSQSSQGGEGDVQEGDRVKFNIGQNELTGTVTGVLTSPSEVDGRVAHASKGEPRVAVQYDGTGNEFIRTMNQVEKIQQEGEGDQNQSDEIRKGDRVAFHIGQNRLEGSIKRILTSPSEVDGRIAHASEDEPRYVIHYDGTDADIIRKEGDVEKMDDDEGERMSTDQSGKRKRDEREGGSSQDKSDSSSKKSSPGKQPNSKKQKNSSGSGRKKGSAN